MKLLSAKVKNFQMLKFQLIQNYKQLKIRQIYIQSNASNIYEDAFKFCDNLQIFEASEDSKVVFLDKAIFETIEKVIIMIPQKIRKLIKNNQ